MQGKSTEIGRKAVLRGSFTASKVTQQRPRSEHVRQKATEITDPCFREFWCMMKGLANGGRGLWGVAFVSCVLFGVEGK
jgi:hypothetical protein